MKRKITPLTKDQEKWLNHLTDTDKVKIIPYDSRVKEVFKQQQKDVQSILGDDAIVLHKGASAWGISGKGDVDIYIPVAAEYFDHYFGKLKQAFGEPGNYYPKERVRWNKQVDDIEVEIFLVNQEATFWKESLLFWDYIETHPNMLDEYRRIKEKAGGRSIREYYTRKVIFINKIMQLIRES